jgi:hypothetical protein
VVQSGRCEWGLVTSGKSAMSFLIAYPSPRARGCSLEAGAWGKGRALRNRMRKSRWWTRSDFVMPLFLALALSAPARASDALLGYVDGLRPQGNGDLNLVGWACARGVSTPLHVDLYVGGSFGHGGTLIGRFLGGLDLQMNADPLQPSVIVRADWSGKVMQVTLTPRAISTVLDCSAGGVHFAEASRGPNGAYYFLADEAPYKGPDIQQLVAEVYQHDVFVAF